MAHKTLIGGTAYEISGGKTLIDGTAYDVVGGRTLVDGTEYSISFGPRVTITFTGNYTGATYNAIYCIVDGNTYLANSGSISVPYDTAVSCVALPVSLNGGEYIYINGELCKDSDGNNFSAIIYVAMAQSDYSNLEGAFSGTSENVVISLNNVDGSSVIEITEL